MILELDLGNTRAKWRVVSDQLRVSAQGVSVIDDWFDGRFPEAWERGVRSARVASVLAPVKEDELMAKMQSKLSIPIRMARSSASCCGVTNAYKNPDRLGVDRWLALISAYKLFGEAVMVVDVGTALKVDVVDAEGGHLGGYIIPGALLMESALQQGTDRVRYDEGLPIDSILLGRDTRSCVQHGVTAALVGAVKVALDQCMDAIGKRPHLCMTGGSGILLKQRLHEAGILNIRFEADLVLDGLHWVLP